MKIIIMLLMLAVAAPALAATETTETGADTAKEQADARAQAGENARKDAKDQAAANEKKPAPGEFSCKYYTVTLPEGWKAIRAPEERQGLVNAIFANHSDTTIITLIVGPRKGADASLIAGMFADQFKAPKAPVEKNGRYIFSFPQTNAATQKKVTVTANVGVYGEDFMLATYLGNQKEVQQFLKNNLKGAEDYTSLMPQ